MISVFMFFTELPYAIVDLLVWTPELILEQQDPDMLKMSQLIRLNPAPEAGFLASPQHFSHGSPVQNLCVPISYSLLPSSGRTWWSSLTTKSRLHLSSDSLLSPSPFWDGCSCCGLLS